MKQIRFSSQRLIAIGLVQFLGTLMPRLETSDFSRYISSYVMFRTTVVLISICIDNLFDIDIEYFAFGVGLVQMVGGVFSFAKAYIAFFQTCQFGVVGLLGLIILGARIVEILSPATFEIIDDTHDHYQ